MHSTPPDKNYLDAFLQGARFSLFAMEGALKGKGDLSAEEVQQLIDQLHEVFRSTHAGLRDRAHVVRLDPMPGAVEIRLDDLRTKN